MVLINVFRGVALQTVAVAQWATIKNDASSSILDKVLTRLYEMWIFIASKFSPGGRSILWKHN